MQATNTNIRQNDFEIKCDQRLKGSLYTKGSICQEDIINTNTCT